MMHVIKRGEEIIENKFFDISTTLALDLIAS